MTYPAAYRKGSQKYQQAQPKANGFQNSPTPRPVAANDNQVAANDNESYSSKWNKSNVETQDNVERAARRAAARAAARFLGRFVPYVNLALTGYDIYTILYKPGTGGEPVPDTSGYGPGDSLPLVPSDEHTFRDPSAELFAGSYPTGIKRGVHSTDWIYNPNSYPAPLLTSFSTWSNPSEWVFGPDLFSVGKTEQWFDTGLGAPQEFVVETQMYGNVSSLADIWAGPMTDPGAAPEAVPLYRPRYERQPRMDYFPGFSYDAGNDLPGQKAQADPFAEGAPLVGTLVINGPGIKPGAAPAPKPHSASKPPPGTKEVKATAGKAFAGLLGKVLNGVTESVDFIEAVWDALPDRYKKGYYKLHKKDGSVFYKKRFNANPQEKLEDLYKNIDKLDINSAIYNIAVNQLEDAAFGKLGKKAQEAARPMLEKLGRPVGLQTGPAM